MFHFPDRGDPAVIPTQKSRSLCEQNAHPVPTVFVRAQQLSGVDFHMAEDK